MEFANVTDFGEALQNGVLTGDVVGANGEIIERDPVSAVVKPTEPAEPAVLTDAERAEIAQLLARLAARRAEHSQADLLVARAEEARAVLRARVNEADRVAGERYIELARARGLEPTAWEILPNGHWRMRVP